MILTQIVALQYRRQDISIVKTLVCIPAVAIDQGRIQSSVMHASHPDWEDADVIAAQYSHSLCLTAEAST